MKTGIYSFISEFHFAVPNDYLKECLAIKDFRKKILKAKVKKKMNFL